MGAASVDGLHMKHGGTCESPYPRMQARDLLTLYNVCPLFCYDGHSNELLDEHGEFTVIRRNFPPKRRDYDTASA